MRKELYASDPGVRMPALEAATVTVRIAGPHRRNYLKGSPLTAAAEALRSYLHRRDSLGAGVPGNEVARYLQRWCLPADDRRRTEVSASLGWGLLWDISRAKGYGVSVTVGRGSPWPSVRDPHAPARPSATRRAYV